MRLWLCYQHQSALIVAASRNHPLLAVAALIPWLIFSSYQQYRLTTVIVNPRTSQCREPQTRPKRMKSKPVTPCVARRTMATVEKQLHSQNLPWYCGILHIPFPLNSTFSSNFLHSASHHRQGKTMRV